MDRNQKLWIGIGAGALVVLLGLFFYFNRHKSIKKDPTIAEAKKTKEVLHQVCAYADSVGIDTTQYTVTTASIDETNAESVQQEAGEKLTRLMAEIRYGKKLPKLAYSGQKETIDTTWIGSIKASDTMVDSLRRLPVFEPYGQLVRHYDRLRATASKDSLREIKKTLNFYRWLNRFDNDRFVVVNIPAAELNVYDKSGKTLLPMRVIVGKKDTQTPVFTAYMTDIITYPYWNVPEGIAVKEMLPRLQRNPGYLEEQSLQVLDKNGKEVDPYSIDWNSVSASNFPYRFRQSTGCDNSLGVMKFNMTSPFAIYMHDTNARSLFSASEDRWRSHGCMRLERPVELANFLLGEQKFDAGFLDRCMIDQKPRTFALPKKFPVFVMYNVADVDASGQLRFYNNVYNLAM